jgi:hypothetical protein
MLLLKKVLYTLHKHARQSSALRRALASLQRRHLQQAWTALQHALSTLLQRPTAALTPVKALAQQQVVVRDGRGRQGHCKCVYGVTGSGNRCKCAPAAHLLRRVEELHKLVTHAMHSPDYRLLSHVTQYRVVASDSNVTNATAAAANATNSVSAGRVSRDAVEQQAASRRHLCYDDDAPGTAAIDVSSSGSVNRQMLQQPPQQQQQHQRRVPLQPRPRAQRDRPQPHTSSSSASSALNRRAAVSSSKADQVRQPTTAAVGRPRKNRPNPNVSPISSYGDALHSRRATPQQQQQQQQQRRSKSPVRTRRPPGMPPRHDMSHW